jgi:hypothetical protein
VPLAGNRGIARAGLLTHAGDADLSIDYRVDIGGRQFRQAIDVAVSFE